MKGKCHATRFFRWIYVFAIPIWYIIAMTVKIPKVNRFRFQFMVKSILEYVHGTWNILQKLFKFFWTLQHQVYSSYVNVLLQFKGLLNSCENFENFFPLWITKITSREGNRKKPTSCTMSLIFLKKSKLFFFMEAT